MLKLHVRVIHQNSASGIESTRIYRILRQNLQNDRTFFNTANIALMGASGSVYLYTLHIIALELQVWSRYLQINYFSNSRICIVFGQIKSLTRSLMRFRLRVLIE